LPESTFDFHPGRVLTAVLSGGRSSIVDESLASKIEAIRTRLVEIEDERSNLADDAFAAKTDLLDEEHELQARLAELKDRAAAETAGAAEVGAAEQTDLTAPPRLPDSGAPS
jgi:predicted nuclease with TOPRIM domain